MEKNNRQQFNFSNLLADYGKIPVLVILRIGSLILVSMSVSRHSFYGVNLYEYN